MIYSTCIFLHHFYIFHVLFRIYRHSLSQRAQQLQEQLSRLQSFSNEYKELDRSLKDLLPKTRHDIMVCKCVCTTQENDRVGCIHGVYMYTTHKKMTEWCVYHTRR